MMRCSVARSRCRFSSFSARSEPGGLCLLLAAAAPAAPVEEPVDVVFCSPLRVSMADKVCCCWSRREPAISKAAVAPPAHVHAGQSERSTGLDCPKLNRVSCAQLDRNGEVETIAHLDSERPPQRPSLCGAAAQRRIPLRSGLRADRRFRSPLAPRSFSAISASRSLLLLELFRAATSASLLAAIASPQPFRSPPGLRRCEARQREGGLRGASCNQREFDATSQHMFVRSTRSVRICTGLLT